jgi:hypothetical protein
MSYTIGPSSQPTGVRPRDEVPHRSLHRSSQSPNRSLVRATLNGSGKHAKCKIVVHARLAGSNSLGQIKDCKVKLNIRNFALAPKFKFDHR